MEENRELLTPERCSARLEQLAGEYSLARLEVARSILGRPVELITIGEGKRRALFVGAHHASEWLTAEALLRFAGRLCAAAQDRLAIAGADAAALLRQTTLHILPMLNPDGVAVQQGGASAGALFAERLLRQNEGSEDFRHWQANVRGVDLNHNYDAGWYEGKMLEREAGIFGGCASRYGGEFPESEPETAGLCAYVRAAPPDLVLALHSQGEEIYCDFDGRCPPRAAGIAALMAKRSGYQVVRPEGTAAFSGFKDWFIDKYNRPGFTVEMGRGENPLPPEELDGCYGRLERILTVAALMA